MMYKRPVIIMMTLSLFEVGMKSQPSTSETEEKAMILQLYCRREKEQLNKVKSFYDNITEFSSTADRDIRIPEQCNIDKRKIDLHLEDMMIAFIVFRNKIKDYYEQKRAAAALCKMKSENSNKMLSSQYDNILRMILTMSLDFILSADALYNKQPDIEVPRIIHWNNIHSWRMNYNQNHIVNSPDNNIWYERMKVKFMHFNYSSIFYHLNNEVQKHVYLEKVNEIWDFISQKLTGNVEQARTAHETSWYGTTYSNSKKMWEKLMDNYFVSDASTENIDRVRNAIRTIIYIREFDWTLEHFITFGVRTQDTYDMKQFLNSLQCSGFWNYRMFNL